jgi:FAD/FMN-containing dehydrogenase
MSASDFTQRLVQALGPDTVLTAEADIAPWLSDWRGLYKGQAQAVVRPRTTDEVATCLALCQQAGVPVVPRGGNTGLCGGATPDSGAANVVLSLDRMNAVRAIDTVANTMVAEAGAILGNLRRAAQEAGRLLPLSLAAEDSSQIGGNVATNAGGVNVVRYGMARELVLGLEAVLPTGEVFHGLRTLRKDNTGYDLKQLLIGSEGTLGVITAVALRLFPRTDVRSVVLAAVESPAQALQLFELLFEQCGARLQAFEYFSGDCLDLVLAHAEGVQEPFAQRYPGYVLVELADTADEAALNTLLENVIGTEAARGDLRGAARRRSAPEARRVAADRTHPRVHGIRRGARARALPGHPPVHLRPLRRRQSALQPVAPRGRRPRLGGGARRGGDGRGAGRGESLRGEYFGGAWDRAVEAGSFPA